MRGRRGEESLDIYIEEWSEIIEASIVHEGCRDVSE